MARFDLFVCSCILWIYSDIMKAVRCSKQACKVSRCSLSLQVMMCTGCVLVSLRSRQDTI